LGELILLEDILIPEMPNDIYLSNKDLAQEPEYNLREIEANFLSHNFKGDYLYGIAIIL